MPSSPCGRCGRILEFSGQPPLFCAYCGQPLSSTFLSATIEYSPDPGRESPLQTVQDSGAEESVPNQIAAYRVLRKIGEGGMGTVFEAEEPAQGRRVALKVLSSRFDAGNDSLERFRQEGRLASTIAHPRCVFVLAADEADGRPYIVMELMTGSTLQSLVEQHGPLDPVSAVLKILDVVDGLIEAHRLGVIHRDVKPSNCFLETDGRVKVGDFGLSKSLSNQAHLTRTGAFVGTPLYASPEQIKGEPLDPRTDQYSVSATLYFLVTGRPPFEAPDAAATLARIVSETPVSPRELNPEVPPELEAVILRGMDRDRDRRYDDLEEFRQELLPFSPAPLPAAELGSRVAAFAIDLFLLLILEAILSLGLSQGFARFLSATPIQPGFLSELFMTVVLWSTYFGLGDGLWGKTLGKRLMRIRVQEASKNRTPGIARALIRVAVLFSVQFLPVLTSHELFLRSGAKWELTGWTSTYLLTNAVLIAAGSLALISMMSERNGYRGLHELLSGTRVARPPRRQIRDSSISRRVVGRDRGEVPRPVGVLRQVGPYKIRGAVRWDTDRRVLSAQDSVLGREVWVVLKPRDGEPPSLVRRHLVRPTRPRWLAGGVQAEGRWDAYVAPAGCPLADLAGPDGLPWEEVKPLLLDLSTELAASCEDSTLPLGLHPDQVWIEPDGRLLLVDPLGDLTRSDGPALDLESKDRRALRLFASVSALALEGGRRRLDDRSTPVRAAIPLHARETLDRLFGRGRPITSATELLELIESQREYPTRLDPVTRAFRAISFVASIPLRIGAVLGVLNFLHAADLLPQIPTILGFLNPERLLFYLSIVGWIVLSGLTRGRVLSTILGVALVGNDGRRPSMPRCMLREAMVWLPPLLLHSLITSLLALLPDPSGPIASALQLIPLSWIFLDAAHELVDPGRTLHDRLSGTLLVPR